MPLSCEQFEQGLGDFQEGLLPPEAAAEMRWHGRQCLACSALAEALRRTMDLLADLPEPTLPPRLTESILARTSRQRAMLSWRETLRTLLAFCAQPRVTLGFGVAVFALGLVLSATGVNLRRVRWSSWTPERIVLSVQRNVHHGVARGASYYSDLKLVYEIEATLRQMHSAPALAPAGAPSGFLLPPPRGAGPTFGTPDAGSLRFAHRGITNRKIATPA